MTHKHEKCLSYHERMMIAANVMYGHENAFVVLILVCFLYVSLKQKQEDSLKILRN